MQPLEMIYLHVKGTPSPPPITKYISNIKTFPRYVFGLARCGSTIGFHLLWHTIELAMSTRLCLL